MTRLLLVEDDPAVLATLEAAVRYGGFECEAARDATRALAAVAEDGFDAVLLDLGLPDRPGEELLPAIREMTPVPIIVVSGQASEQDKIRALDLGADDFVPKPFLPGELLARIRAALRRHSVAGATPGPDRLPVNIGMIKMDPLDRSVSVAGEATQLNHAEYRVLARLAASAGSVVPRSDLLETLYGAEGPEETKVVDVYLSRIRAKLRQIGAPENLIVSHRGTGWSLEAD